MYTLILYHVLLPIYYTIAVRIFVEYILWLSMVAGNEVNSVNRLRPSYSYRPYRKMADIGVQYDPDDSGMFVESPAFNSTVAEINTSTEFSTAAEINTRVDNFEVDSPSSNHPTRSRPHSTGSASSTNSGSREKRRTDSDGDVDVDAICEDGIELSDLGLGEAEGQTERDGRPQPTPQSHHQAEPDDKPDNSCGLDCLYFTMKCCECTIL